MGIVRGFKKKSEAANSYIFEIAYFVPKDEGSFPRPAIIFTLFPSWGPETCRLFFCQTDQNPGALAAAEEHYQEQR